MTTIDDLFIEYHFSFAYFYYLENVFSSWHALVYVPSNNSQKIYSVDTNEGDPCTFYRCDTDSLLPKKEKEKEISVNN